jgi:hypothetical protein
MVVISGSNHISAEVGLGLRGTRFAESAAKASVSSEQLFRARVVFAVRLDMIFETYISQAGMNFALPTPKSLPTGKFYTELRAAGRTMPNRFYSPYPVLHVYSYSYINMQVAESFGGRDHLVSRCRPTRPLRRGRSQALRQLRSLHEFFQAWGNLSPDGCRKCAGAVLARPPPASSVR